MKEGRGAARTEPVHRHLAPVLPGLPNKRKWGSAKIPPTPHTRPEADHWRRGRITATTNTDAEASLSSFKYISAIHLSTTVPIDTQTKSRPPSSPFIRFIISNLKQIFAFTLIFLVQYIHFFSISVSGYELPTLSSNCTGNLQRHSQRILFHQRHNTKEKKCNWHR